MNAEQGLAVARLWLQDVRRDLEDAQHSLAGGRYALCCWSCHQAAEKSYKALKFLAGEDFERVQRHHDVQDFHEELLPMFPDLADVDDAVRVFGDYGSGVRYPVVQGARWVLPADRYGRERTEAGLRAARRIAEAAVAAVGVA